MKRLVKIAVVAALSLGTVGLATAQAPTPTPTREQMFADYVKQMVAFNTAGAGWKANVLGARPQFSGTSDDPVAGRSFSEAFAQMQADSSDGGEFRREPPAISAQPTDPVGRESFADMFARMQATSSNSGQFRVPVHSNAPAFAMTPGVNLARRTPEPWTPSSN